MKISSILKKCPHSICAAFSSFAVSDNCTTFFVNYFLGSTSYSDSPILSVWWMYTTILKIPCFVAKIYRIVHCCQCTPFWVFKFTSVTENVLYIFFKLISIDTSQTLTQMLVINKSF